MPHITTDTATLARPAGTNSTAAKRYCCTHAMLAPMTNTMAQKSAKLRSATAQATPSADRAASPAPSMKVRLRPIACMSIAAGMVVAATPRTPIEIGSVAHSARGASSAPRIAPRSTITKVPEAASAWAAANR
jgi:hypothetical protein